MGLILVSSFIPLFPFEGVYCHKVDVYLGTVFFAHLYTHNDRDFQAVNGRVLPLVYCHFCIKHSFLKPPLFKNVLLFLEDALDMP